ncbi:ABC transporter ATP-binding protein [Candidatus Methanoprimaticola sp. MG2]|uniref:ABC transporter ATP-binding protein n=1 Tax=Candidatus Methanoprimaticola sp. MG2 TaxID=3228838 RepID=UPI0039C65560
MKALLNDYLKPHWKEVLLLLALTLLQVFVQLQVMAHTKSILDDGVATSDMDFVVSSGIRMIALTVLYGLCMVAVSYLASRLTSTITCDIRKDVFSKILSFSQSDFNRFGGASLMTRVTSDTTRVQIFFIDILRDAMQVPVLIIALTLAAAFINPTLCAVLVVAFAITMAFLFVKSFRTLPMFMKVQQKLDVLNDLFREKLDGVRTIRAFGRQSHEMRRFDDMNDDLNEASYRASLKLYYLTPVGLLAMNLCILVIYYLGSMELQSGIVEISDLILFFQYITYFISCLAIVPFIVRVIPKTIVASERLEEVLGTEPSMDTADDVQVASGSDIEFRDVSFGYPGAKSVVSGISFKVKAGTTTALIGSTGSGKTTIVNMVNRMCDPTTGSVLIGGVDVRRMDLVALRDSVSVASQRTMVLNDTVYANVSMGSGISREDAYEACRLSLFSEALDGMPDGLDTVMAQGGMNVSGGQRQRLSLARAVAKDADVYVFDDCFSALDAKTEAAARRNIKEHLKGKTVLMVAQKISTIRDADNIIVMDKGRIVAQGTHESLMRECGLYQEFHAIQSYVSKEGME